MHGVVGSRRAANQHSTSNVMSNLPSTLVAPSGQDACCDVPSKLPSGRAQVSEDRSEKTAAQRMAEQMERKGLETEAEEGAHWLLDCVPFKGLVGAAVLANTIAMGIEADYPEWAAVWATTEYSFTAVFLSEAVLKLLVMKLRFFGDRWNWLDFSLVSLSVLDIVALHAGIGLDLQSLSILRIFRLFRLVRVLRLVKRVRKFVLVINGIIDAMTATMYVSGVMVLTIYVAAVFLVGFLGGAKGAQYPGYTEDLEEIDTAQIMADFNPHILFGSVGASMLTLFNVAILSEWPEVVRPLMIKQPHLVFFFIFFIAFVTFGVMNVIIGMIVENVVSNARIFEAQEKVDDLKQKLSTLDQIQEIWRQLTPHGSKSVDIEALESCVRDQASGLQQLMRKVDLPRGFSARELLHMLDDTGDGALDQDELVEGFYRLVDSGPFQSICIVQKGINELKFQVGESQKSVEKKVGDVFQIVERRIAKLEATITSPGLDNDKNWSPLPTSKFTETTSLCAADENIAAAPPAPAPDACHRRPGLELGHYSKSCRDMSQQRIGACPACVELSEALRGCATRASGRLPELEALAALGSLVASRVPHGKVARDAPGLLEGIPSADSTGSACSAGSAGSGKSTGSTCSASRGALELLDRPILLTFDQRLHDMGLQLQWNGGAAAGARAPLAPAPVVLEKMAL